MSFEEVMAELPKLTPEQRDLVRIRLAVLAGEEWMDDGEFTPEQRALIEKRIAAHRADPASAVSLEEMRSRLRARFPG